MRCILALVVLAACEPVPREEDPSAEDFSLGDIHACAAPVSGWDRLSEEGASRGLTTALDGGWMGEVFDGKAAAVAQDVDADGDIDVLAGQSMGVPLLWLNDGRGFFSRGPNLSVETAPQPVRSTLLAAVDLDGDHLPELIAVGDQVTTWANLGGGEFGVGQWTDPRADGRLGAFALGDLDRDGDLDMVVGTTIFGPGQPTPAEQILLFDGGSFQHFGALHPTGTTGISTQLLLFTDRDQDGDQDLLATASVWAGGQPTAFFRNDSTGDVDLQDDATERGVRVSILGMGADSMDLNRDGQFDYCITDVGPSVCLLSDGDGWLDGTAATGLTPADPPYPEGGTAALGWSLDFADLDDDGHPDVVHASAPDHVGLETGHLFWPDLLFRGLPDGTFEDVTAESGFGALDPHYGLATADFDADGSLDVVVVGPGVPPLLWMNQCGGARLDVELVGPPENTEGLGAIALLVDSRGTQLRELYGVRATGQSVSRFHFGLGDDVRVKSLEIRWPDGHVSTRTDFEPDRLVTVRHPRSDGS